MPKTIHEIWQTQLDYRVCNHCGTAFLLPPDRNEQICLNCFDLPLEPINTDDDDPPQLIPPEAVVPVELKPEQVQYRYDQFVQSIPFKPRDLSIQNLMKRIQLVYVPVWWLDVKVKAQWQAEVGYNYDVVSSRSTYKNGWHSQNVTETRIKWEMRYGEMERSYDNVAAPALDRMQEFRQRLGDFDFQKARPYEPALLKNAMVRLHERSPQDAWSDAATRLMQIGGEDVRQACEGQAIRNFKWTTEFSDEHWTMLLLPLYISFYFNTDGRRHWVLVNGQNGKTIGEKTAQLRSAAIFSTMIFAVAALIFVPAMFMTFLASGVIGTMGAFMLLLAVGLALAAVIPFGRAWLFNANQKTDTEALT